MLRQVNLVMAVREQQAQLRDHQMFMLAVAELLENQ
tara:strand:+ start:1499 stop:1606 length:108 start_codon:yes stop_codon:yes gene_type:complete